MQRLGGVIDGVDYHTFYLVADEDLSGFLDGDLEDDISPHTLVVPTGNSVGVITGIAMGQVNLTIEVLDAAPGAMDDRRPWEAVSEVSFEARTSGARIAFMAWGPEPPFDSFELATGTGWYRVRAHAVGRNLDVDAVVSENPREEHLLQLWRTDGFQPARHHRMDNSWAGQWAKRDVPGPEVDEHPSVAEEIIKWNELVDQIAGLGPEDQRRVAHWAASTVCELAGATALDWGPALEALRDGRPLPPPFNDPVEAWTRLNQWLRTVAVAPDGADAQDMSRLPGVALSTVLYAADPNPTEAAVSAMYGATGASNYYEVNEALIAAMRRTFGLS